MHADVCQRYDKLPSNYVVDGGFVTNDDITQVEQSGSQVVAPMTHKDRIRKRGGDPHARRAGDSNEMFAFRQRMETDEAKAIFEAMNANDDGKLTRQEFVDSGEIKDKDLANKVFAALDSDDNGELVVPEYLRVWGRWARSGRKTQITVSK